jgi:hypothetical protein
MEGSKASMKVEKRKKKRRTSYCRFVPRAGEFFRALGSSRVVVRDWGNPSCGMSNLTKNLQQIDF